MRWLITGGMGFIGTNLVLRLLRDQQPHGIRVVDSLRYASNHSVNHISAAAGEDFRFVDDDFGPVPDKGVEVVVADIRNKHRAQQLARGADVIVHLAALTGVRGLSYTDTKLGIEVNIDSTVHYLEAAAFNRVPRFILASTAGALFNGRDMVVTERRVPSPVSSYGASKVAAEAYASAYAAGHGIDAVALRFTNVYGPYSDSKNSAIARWIRQSLEHQRIEIFGTGEATRDFVHVHDVVEAVVSSALLPEAPGEIRPYVIGSGTAMKMLGVAELVQGQFKARNLGVPRIVHSEPRGGEVEAVLADPSRARNDMGWRATIPLRQGISRTIDWFLSLS